MSEAKSPVETINQLISKKKILIQEIGALRVKINKNQYLLNLATTEPGNPKVLEVLSEKGLQIEELKSNLVKIIGKRQALLQELQTDLTIAKESMGDIKAETYDQPQAFLLGVRLMNNFKGLSQHQDPSLSNLKWLRAQIQKCMAEYIEDPRTKTAMLSFDSENDFITLNKELTSLHERNKTDDFSKKSLIDQFNDLNNGVKSLRKKYKLSL
ncbi:MAG: hypothetical protein ACRCXZ_03175 [Patescibacteria group bacterium]